ncbi:MAG: hypothetical protein IJ311_03605 [Elusimicrobiaceae bacterium]|nr:hypothetical protein [Elusimicrobiaceae bacterium]
MHKVCRVLLLSVILLTEGICFPAPWGTLPNYHDPDPQKETKAVGDRYLLRQIVQGQPIVVDLILEPEDEPKRAEFQTFIRQSYQQWFRYPAELIRKQKRTEEFVDVLPVLEKGVMVRFSDEDPDIYFFIKNYKEVLKDCSAVGGAGCYVFAQESNGFVPEIYIPKNNFLLKFFSNRNLSSERIALHEIGHSLGLSDQYSYARDNNTHSLYRSSKPAESMMASNNSLTCDDADAIINLIDITRGTSRGEDTGWRSFCKKSTDYYSHGKVLDNGVYHIAFNEETERWELMSVQEGVLQAEASFGMDLQTSLDPFVKVQETILQRDGSNRPVRARLSTGEEVYYSYVYDRKIRLVVHDGKASLVDVWTPAWKRVKWRMFSGKQREIYFGGDGKHRYLAAAFYSKRGGGLEYSEGNSFFSREKMINMTFDKEKKLEYEDWYGYEDGLSGVPAEKYLSLAKPSATLEEKLMRINQRKGVDQLRQSLLEWYEGIK